QFDLRGERLAPLHFLAGIGGHAAEDRGHGALGAIDGFAVFLVLANGREEIVMLLLVRILRALGFVAPGFIGEDLVLAHVGAAFGALHVLAHAVPAAGLMA